jgi:hypothetical protein
MHTHSRFARLYRPSRAAFSAVPVGNQIADYARLTASGRHHLVARRSARSGAACWALWLPGCVSSGLALPVIFPASKDHSGCGKEDTRHWNAAGRLSVMHCGNCRNVAEVRRASCRFQPGEVSQDFRARPGAPAGSAGFEPGDRCYDRLQPGRGSTPPSSARRTSASTATPGCADSGERRRRQPGMLLIVITAATIPGRTPIVLAVGHHAGASSTRSG